MFPVPGGVYISRVSIFSFPIRRGPSQLVFSGRMTSLLTCDCPIDTITFSPLSTPEGLDYLALNCRTCMSILNVFNLSLHYQVSLSREESLSDKYICAYKVSIPAANPTGPIQYPTHRSNPPSQKPSLPAKTNKTRGYTSGHLIYACYLPALIHPILLLPREEP